MRCQGIVIYKGIEKRDGGTFKNDKGQEVNYDSSYVLKFDEIKESGGDERKLKFPASNRALYDKFKNIKPYTQVLIDCDVVLSSNICKLVPVDVIEDIKTVEDEEN